MRDCGIGCSPFVYIYYDIIWHKKAPPQFAEELLCIGLSIIAVIGV